MTREEAIRKLKSKMDGHTDISYEWVETVRMAIKALESQSCEDCISREDTLNKINTLIAEYIPLMPAGWTLPLNIAKTINDLPSVTPQPKIGHWIVIRGEYEFMGGIVNEPRGCKCSNCNKIVRFKSDFCPSCGAKMESEVQE